MYCVYFYTMDGRKAYLGRNGRLWVTNKLRALWEVLRCRKYQNYYVEPYKED